MAETSEEQRTLPEGWSLIEDQRMTEVESRISSAVFAGAQARFSAAGAAYDAARLRHHLRRHRLTR